jgi:dethiobiotin synthetase
MNYFVTGIDTDSGKTVVSAILCVALSADYWKPIQAGSPGDRDEVMKLVAGTSSHFHPERYFLKTPASPHAAAAIDDVNINLDDFTLPVTKRDLVIEGAGGCLVPINEQDFVIDLATRFPCQVVLVADLYLGSINHTLLTVRELQRRKLNVKGIIFNGPANPESERIILKHSGFRCLLRIRKEEKVDASLVTQYAEELLTNWHG